MGCYEMSLAVAHGGSLVGVRHVAGGVESRWGVVGLILVSICGPGSFCLHFNTWK